MRLLYVGVAFAALVDGACSTDSFTGDAGPDAMTDAIADVSADGGPDGGIAGDAAGCPGTWCDCVPKMPAFCDDFDRDAEYAGALWDDKTGFIKDEGGVIELNTDMPESPPKYMFAHVFANSTSRIETAVTEDIAAPTSKGVMIAFDLLVPGTAGNCTNGDPEILRFGADNSFLRDPQLSIAFGIAAGTPTLFFQANASNPKFTLADINIGSWVRVRVTITATTQDAGGALVKAAVAYGNAGAPDGTGASDAGVGQVLTFVGTPAKAWVSLGSMDWDIGSTGDCVVHVDNVAIYQ